jgi:hypothetical protein
MLFLIGCEKKDQIETVEKSNIVCEKRESIDMSQEAVGKRWFNANFNTSLDEIANLQGTCVAWGGDGKCAYSFETEKDVALSPKRKMVEASCNTIYGGLTYAFSGIEKEVKVSDISCLVGSESNNGVNIASTKNGNKHFVWEFYAVQ